MTLESRLRELYISGGLTLPAPGSGFTLSRHRRLAEIAREDLSLARLAEAHVDAIAILAEAGCEPHPGVYGVWAAETAHLPLRLTIHSQGATLSGTKMFCTGAGLLDRALISVDRCLVDVDLRESSESISIDQSGWKTSAFAETQTSTVTFSCVPIAEGDLIGRHDWYLNRPGFWHGACGPAACWAGGAMGLVDYANSQSRDDPHTMAHLAAMNANAWALQTYLDRAALEIDSLPDDTHAAQVRALTVRHLIEEACTDILQRLGRAFGPRALAFNAEVSKRYQELELYIRQSHAERDLELLGRCFRNVLTLNKQSVAS